MKQASKVLPPSEFMSQDPARILLTCLGYESETIKLERLSGITAEAWQAVAELARRQDVGPLLYHHLQHLGTSVPDKLLIGMKRDFLKNTARNIRLFNELGKILKRLQEKDIPVVVLKGIHLAESVYENIGLRKMVDIDILVRKEDLRLIEKELTAMGYIPNDFNHIIAQDNKDFTYTLPTIAVNLEIHWSLVDPEYPFRFDLEALWNRAQPVTLSQGHVLILSPADLLLYLCFHTAKHTWDMQLKMLCDIGEVVKRYDVDLDWTAIEVRARQWGILRAVYVIIRLAQELLGVAVPKDWITSVKPANFDEHYLSLARHQMLAGEFFMKGSLLQSPSIAKLWGLKGLGSKFVLMRERLFLSRETMALTYPVPANSWRIYLYYLVRLRELLMRQSVTLWRLARGDPQKQAEVVSTNQVTELHDWLMSN